MKLGSPGIPSIINSGAVEEPALPRVPWPLICHVRFEPGLPPSVVAIVN